MGWLKRIFGPEKTIERRVERYEPAQRGLLEQTTQGLGDALPMGLSNIKNILGGDQSHFQGFEAPARRAFQEQTIPAIAERFSSDYGEGSQTSPAFAQAFSSAGRRLEENLFAQRGDRQNQAMTQLMNLFRPALEDLQNVYREPERSFARDFTKSAMPQAASAAVSSISSWGPVLAKLLGLIGRATQGSKGGADKEGTTATGGV